MKDYCTCGFRRIERTFLSEGIVFCTDCLQPKGSYSSDENRRFIWKT